MRAKSVQVKGRSQCQFVGQRGGRPALYITSAKSGCNANYRAERSFDDKLGNFPVKFCYRRQGADRLPIAWVVCRILPNADKRFKFVAGKPRIPINVEALVPAE